jgi:hypothetical protein
LYGNLAGFENGLAARGEVALERRVLAAEAQAEEHDRQTEVLVLLADHCRELDAGHEGRGGARGCGWGKLLR